MFKDKELIEALQREQLFADMLEYENSWYNSQFYRNMLSGVDLQNTSLYHSLGINCWKAP